MITPAWLLTSLRVLTRLDEADGWSTAVHVSLIVLRFCVLIVKTLGA